MKKSDRVVGQVSSGRWLLTIIAGGCLLMLTFLDCRAYLTHPDKPLPVSVEAIFAVITMVFMSYFNKTRDDSGQVGEPEVQSSPVEPQGGVQGSQGQL
jgi:hypothetical protein